MKFFMTLLLIASGSAFACPTIIKGTSATSKEAPWVVKIEKNKGPHCTGSIVAAKWILTAGHCFYERTLSSYTILGGGDGSLKKLQLLPPIKRIVVHPKFYSSIVTPASDIALVELTKEIPFSDSLNAISLLGGADFETIRENDEVSIYGWGSVGKNLEQPTELRKISLPLVPAIQYANLRGLLFFKRFSVWLDSTKYLITMKTGVSTCGGDSGTGWTMIYQGEPHLVAVHNAGDDCDGISVGNIVGNHLPWIQSIVTF